MKKILGIFFLVSVVTCQQQVTSDQQLTLKGKIHFPGGPRNYSYIPPEACLNLFVEQLCCGTVTHVQIHANQISVDDNNVMEYEVKAARSGYDYSLRIVFNIKKCHSNGSYMAGDYMSLDNVRFYDLSEVYAPDITLHVVDSSSDFFVNPSIITTVSTRPTTTSTTTEATTTQTSPITSTGSTASTMTFSSSQSPLSTPSTSSPIWSSAAPTVTVIGVFKLPSKGFYQPLPDEGCIKAIITNRNHLRITEQNFIVDLKHTDIVNNVIYVTFKDARLVLGEDYSLVATVNWGWCARHNIFEKRSDDYQSLYDAPRRTYVGGNQFTLHVDLHECIRYQCGSNQCKSYEGCLVSLLSGETKCERHFQTTTTSPQYPSLPETTDHHKKKPDHHGKKKDRHEISEKDKQASKIVLCVVSVLMLFVILGGAILMLRTRYDNISPEKTSPKRSPLKFVGYGDEKKLPQDEAALKENMYFQNPQINGAMSNNHGDANSTSVYLEKVDYVKFDN